MRPYLVLVLLWTLSAWSFYHFYYAIKYPDKYVKASWAMMRGLKRVPESAQHAAGVMGIAGIFFFSLGCVLIHSILNPPTGPLPPLP